MSYPYRDPRIKSSIKLAITISLYNNSSMSLMNRLNQIIVRNTAINGYADEAFTYKGEYYTYTATGRPRLSNRLTPDLHPIMDEYLADLHALESIEQPTVMGFITKVLNSSNSILDYLLIFPEAFHSRIKEITALAPIEPRKLTDEEVEKLIADNEHAISLLKQRLVLNMIT